MGSFRGGISLGLDGNISFSDENFNKSKRENKGKSILEFTSSFVVLDFETTGLDPAYDEIIEVGAIKVVNGNVESEYTTFIKPKRPISEFITDLTGISNDMVKDAPSIEAALSPLINFIGDSVVLGHNTHFDINFLYDYCMDYLKIPFTNNMIDTIRIARIAFKDIGGYKLSTLAAHFKVKVKPTHRAINDCRCTLAIYNHMCANLKDRGVNLVDLYESNKRKVLAKDITTAVTDFDSSHPLFDKLCVFTGTLDKMPRKDAMQTVADLGGKCADNVTKKTNYLIFGATDYNKSKDGKSNKRKKAEQFQLSGLDIEVISENIFYDMVTMEG